MNPNLAKVLSDVQSLAERRGWPAVAGLARDLAAAAPAPLLFLAARGVDTDPLASWLAESTPLGAAEPQPLEALVQDATVALRADRFLAAFECGRLLEPDAVDALALASFERPPDSYAVVLVGAENICNDDDLDLVQRIAWRLLVSGPKDDWSGQDLQARRCYLWGSDDAAPQFLKPRLRRDRDGLADWLRQERGATALLDRRRVLGVLDLAERQGPGESTPTGSDPSADNRRVAAARASLIDLRSRLLGRLDADARSLEDQLTRSLQTLELDLVQRMRPTLAAAPAAVLADPARAEALIGESIRRAFEEWRRHAETLYSGRGDEIAADTRDLLEGMDWSLVNELAHRQEPGRTYPDALVNWDGFRPDLPESMASPELPRGSWAGQAPTGESSDSLFALFRTVGVMTCTAVAMRIVGIGVPGIAIAAGVVGLGDVLLRTTPRRDDDLPALERYGRDRVQTVVYEVQSRVSQQAAGFVRDMRSHLSREFDALESMLERAYWEARKPAPAPEVGEGDRVQLAELRRRVDEAVADAQG